DLRMVAPVDDRQFGRPGDLAREADAARAQDAAVGKERDLVADARLVRRRVLLVDHPAFGPAEAVAEILQHALAGLVAHRAVEWVSEQGRFECLHLGLPGLLTVGDDDRAVLDRRLAAGHDLELHDWLAVLHFADFDETHPATGHDGERGMPAVVRDENTALLRSLNDVEALVADIHRLVVNVNGCHARSRPMQYSRVLPQSPAKS